MYHVPPQTMREDWASLLACMHIEWSRSSCALLSRRRTSPRLSHLPTWAMCSCWGHRQLEAAGAAIRAEDGAKKDKDQRRKKRGKEKASWLLGGDKRHGPGGGDCVRKAVDMIGRCKRPRLCPPRWTGARTVCSPATAARLLFYRTVVLNGCVHPPCPALLKYPVVLGPKSLAVQHAATG